jgi:hypothetical protein
MNNIIKQITRLAVLSGLVVFGSTSVATAAETRDRPAERPDRPEARFNQMAEKQEQFQHQVGSRMERLEQRLNQIAERQEQAMRQMVERQEQFMRQMAERGERAGPAAPGGPAIMRRPAMPPMPGRPAMAPEGALPMARHVKAVGDFLGLFVLIYLICNILMAVWIFMDIRKRGEGPAIFVAMALFAGIPAALIYSLVRLGDKKAASP